MDSGVLPRHVLEKLEQRAADGEAVESELAAAFPGAGELLDYLLMNGAEALFNAAARSGLLAGGRVNATGQTPLMAACARKWTASVDELIAQDPVQATDADGNSGAHYLCAAGQGVKLPRWCARGGPAAGVNRFGLKPVDIAAEFNDAAGLAWLVEQETDADELQRVLHLLIRLNRPLPGTLLHANYIEKPFTDGLYPVHRAALYGRQDILECLTEAGAGLMAVDEGGNTVLHYAISMGNSRLEQWILNRCPVLSGVKNQEGQLPGDLR